jgi:hypothetical protein
MNNIFPMQLKNSVMQRTMLENFTNTMKERLVTIKVWLRSSVSIMSNSYWQRGDKRLIPHLSVPTFEVGCRRITPVRPDTELLNDERTYADMFTWGRGYIEALASHNVTVRTDSITEAMTKGLKLGDGSVLAVDAIVCATGFDTSCLSRHGIRQPFAKES